MSQDANTTMAKKMKAMMLPRFGGGDQFRREEIERPSPGRGEVLVRIAGTSVNPVDAKSYAGGEKGHGESKLPMRLGVEASGVVTAVGPDPLCPAGAIAVGTA